jgi:hypothetical protein
VVAPWGQLQKKKKITFSPTRMRARRLLQSQKLPKKRIKGDYETHQIGCKKTFILSKSFFKGLKNQKKNDPSGFRTPVAKLLSATVLT